MPLSEDEIKEIAKASAQTVLEGLHRYAVAYKEPETIEQGLQDSMVEERTAADWYRNRAQNAADYYADAKTIALYQDIAVDEDEHYDRFKKRLGALQAEQPCLKIIPENKIYSVPSWPEVKGVFVGDCIARVEAGIGKGKLPGNCYAHAHNDANSKYFGWICVNSGTELGRIEGKSILEPSSHLKHEYRHILTPDHGHDDAFRQCSLPDEVVCR